VALILAVNPGNRHSPTLSRLARELPGCEIMGADSCSVAISAIRKRVPDVLLLPATPARGQADLMAHLKSIPGGVLTLNLPPVESADPVQLAQQIREMLTGVPAFASETSAGGDGPEPAAPAPSGTSTHLIAAATATIAWARTRRGQWSAPHEPDELHEPHEPYQADELYKPIGPYEPIALSEPTEPSDEPDEAGTDGASASAVSFLPRAAAIAVIIGILAAAAWYWPQIRGGSSGNAEPADSPNQTAQPPATRQAPGVPPPATQPEPDPLTNASGWVAVASPFEVSISEGGQVVPLDDQGRAVLPPGRHRLRFQNPERGYDAIRTVQVRPAETTTLTLTPEATIAVTSNEPAEVLIDGTRAGDTPYEGRVGLGPHSVTVRTAGAERQITIDATSKPIQLEVDFSKP
jgi:hypothetical protein